MRKLNKQAGFTLAELLIVVAIIAILVAIGIPAFSTAMERSRETVDLSNIRGAYAEFMAASLGGTANTGYYPITVKQKVSTSWIIDTSGFASNVVFASGTTTLPAPATTTKYVKFTFKDVTGEKPQITMEDALPDGKTADTNGVLVYNDTGDD